MYRYQSLSDRIYNWMMDCLDCIETLHKCKVTWVITDQLVRSCTSVYANYRTIRVAQSKAAFIAKLSIVIEESDESCGWLDLIKARKLSDADMEPLIKEGNEILAILLASRKTAQSNLKKSIK